MNQEFKPYFWHEYSKRLAKYLSHLDFAGFFLAREAEEKKMRLVTGTDGSLSEGKMIRFYWLVDETDGVIADAKFQAFGPSFLVAMGEIVSRLVIHKNYDQASRISAELIDRHVRDKKNIPAFPEEANSFFNMAVSAIDQAVERCSDIPFAKDYVSTPIVNDLAENIIHEWETFSKKQKIKIIEEVIDKQIRPYIELDAGGVKVIDLQGSNVFIAYEGSCTSCYAATGSTLSAIQNILQSSVHPSLSVTPEI